MSACENNDCIREISDVERIDTDAFYRDSIEKGFVKVADIARNIEWTTSTAWGDIQITINLSKPEKDPAAIAAAAKEKDPGKLCDLCVTQGDIDSGYAKNIQLNGEPWALWYSPYAYFNEHCIAMSWEHRPMHIDRAAFIGLCDFVDRFPQYFIGSNADLPIVGGSILAHDHFQGGRHVFPLQEAPIDRAFTMEAFPGVRAGVVKWPLSVLRLETSDRKALIEAACCILDAWCAYSNDKLGISAVTFEGTQAIRHNTITPMLRKNGEVYTLDLALRCNITSVEHPLGAFHVHDHLHHIKKENIGLIEVMGRAILPPRLMREMAIDDPTVRAEIGERFAEVLECCGVFKWDETGQAALDAFLSAFAEH
ncbi:MAG: galactose-1-phosphate uridylyltransferase [Eggerthellaceae bacterium]|nr:galactose-1-phosphate uridylyltransferase [Eggerthellaceae bacterium]